MINKENINQQIQNHFQTLHFSKNNLEEFSTYFSEICIREDKKIEDIFAEEELNEIYQEKNLPWKRKIEKLKEYLKKRRYPSFLSFPPPDDTSGDKLQRESKWIPHQVRNDSSTIHAETLITQIYIEDEVKNSKIAQNVIKNLPRVPKQFIKNAKELTDVQIHQPPFSKGGWGDYKADGLFQQSQVTDINNKKNELVIAEQRGKFLKPCPCSQGCLNCGYYVIENAVNCPYDCKYCYLQTYLNNPYLIVYANTEDLFKELENWDNPLLEKNRALSPFRIGTGEFADSLALDEITDSSLELIPYFLGKQNAILELKTKSDKIKNLLKFNPHRKIVVSWSLNPQKIIDLLEDGCTTLEQRIQAAKKCEEAGYKIGFHFDPIIHYQGWEKDYQDVINQIFRRIKPENIAWISLGALRFSPKLKKIIQQRFPECKIIYDALDVNFDGKIRYLKPIREEMFKKMSSFLRVYSKDLNIYLCMENSQICLTIL